MSEDKKKKSTSTENEQKNSASVKSVQTAPVLKISEIFTYNGDKEESKGN